MSGGIEVLRGEVSLKRPRFEDELNEVRAQKKARCDARPIMQETISKKRKAESELPLPEAKKTKVIKKRTFEEAALAPAEESQPAEKRARCDDHEFVAVEREVEMLRKLFSKMMSKSGCRERPAFHFPRYTDAY
jgi:hypothetical protein